MSDCLDLERPLPPFVLLLPRSSSRDSESRFFPDFTVIGLSRGLPFLDEARLEFGVLLTWFFFLPALATTRNMNILSQTLETTERHENSSTEIWRFWNCPLTSGQLDFALGGDTSTQLTLPFPSWNLFEGRNSTVQMIDQGAGVTAHQHPPSATHCTHIVILLFLLLSWFLDQLFLTANRK